MIEGEKCAHQLHDAIGRGRKVIKIKQRVPQDAQQLKNLVVGKGKRKYGLYHCPIKGSQNIERASFGKRVVSSAETGRREAAATALTSSSVS